MNTVQPANLIAFFEIARQDSGLDEASLASHVGGSGLMQLAPVQILAGTLHLTREAAAIEYCVLAATGLALEDQLIVEIALNLDFLDLPTVENANWAPGVNFRKLGLQGRREYLLNRWQEFHQHLGTENIPRKPADTTLRTGIEPRAFTRLADQLLRMKDLSKSELKDLGGARWVVPGPSATSQLPAATKPKVVVIGSAVMDVIFRLPKAGFPPPDASVQVSSFELHPGGKGLTQAVAAAQLGMDVWLAAAIGDDGYGEQIKKYLELKGVHTDLLQVRPEQQTPVTGVIAYHTGASVALGWKNEYHVRLDPADISSGSLNGQLQVSDFVFLTFEPPMATVNETLKVVAQLRERGSQIRLFVTPAPPYETGGPLVPAHLYSIDLLIANEWESQMLLPEEDPTEVSSSSLSSLAQRLRAMGIQNLCVPSNGQCFVFGLDENLAVPAWPVVVHDNTGERDALCAALAYQLADPSNKLDESTLRWATAAMAASSMKPGVANSMPTVADVERVMANHGRSNSQN